MTRLSGLIALAVLWALPSFAQSPFPEPTVWVSASSGLFSWAPPALGDRDNVVHNVSVGAASGRWMAQGGLQISGSASPFSKRALLFDDLFSGERGDEVDGAPVSYRSLYAVGGPRAASRWFTASVAAGPAATWGTRQRNASTCEGVCSLILILENERYLNLGLASSVQGFVRLDGRLWVGGETMLVANPSSTHLATRLALRVDLLRPGR